MVPFTFTGLAAEHFAAARQQINMRTEGPRADEVWVQISDRYLGHVWRVAPRQAMPLLIGVASVEEAEGAAAMVGGSLRKLDRDEFYDLLLVLGAKEGGDACH